MNPEAAAGRDQISVLLLGTWAAVAVDENPVRLPGATFWRASFDLRVLHALAIRVQASWLLVGEGIDEEALLRAGPAFKQLAPGVRHALLGPADDVDRCEAWLRRGAMVYYPTTAPAQQVIDALSAALTLNALVIDVCFQQVDLVRRLQLFKSLSDAGGSLSARELDVLRLIRRGLSNAAIASALSVTENTIQHHISHIYRKLGMVSRTQAIEQARIIGL